MMITTTDGKKINIKYLDGYINDMISCFFYYDRQEDEDLPRDLLEDAFKNKQYTVDELVQSFDKHVRDYLENL